MASKLYNFIKYMDNNYASNFKDQKFVIGQYFYLNKAFVLWYKKNQQIVLISIIELEYIALEYIIKNENVQIYRFLKKLRIPKLIGAYILYRNNKTSIIL